MTTRAERLRTNRGERIAAYVADASERSFPSEVIEAAKQALVDFVGVAMSLRGYRLKASDSDEARFSDRSVMDIVPTVELQAVEGQQQHEAHLDVYLDSGEHLHADTQVFLGHPDNPMI